MVPRGQSTPAVMSDSKETTEPLQACRRSLKIIRHSRGARGFRLGLGPDFRPVKALLQLQRLLDANAFWARGRSMGDLKHMLQHSAVCVTAWTGNRLVGFGRATGDGVYRGTIWDLVVEGDFSGQGVGGAVVEALLASPALAGCERVYLMTTNSAGFYKKMGFAINQSQVLMIRDKSG